MLATLKGLVKWSNNWITDDPIPEFNLTIFHNLICASPWAMTPWCESPPLQKFFKPPASPLTWKRLVTVQLHQSQRLWIIFIWLRHWNSILKVESISLMLESLKILGLKSDTNWSDIQKKFKTLVKKYHPDKNRGSKKYEDILKKITLAYSQLKVSMRKWI